MMWLAVLSGDWTKVTTLSLGPGSSADGGAGVGADPVASSYDGGKSFGQAGDEGSRALSIQEKPI